MWNVTCGMHGMSHTRTHGMSHTRMHGRIKADDDDTGVNVGMCESHGAGDRCGRRVVRMREHVEMGKSGHV